MLKKEYQLTVDHTMHVALNDDETPLTERISVFFEKISTYLYNICSFDMVVWDLTFVIQWIIVTLQLMRFLGDAYVKFQWNSAVASVFMDIADFVTEIPFASIFTAYVISTCYFFIVVASAMFTCFTHHYYGWIVPLYYMRHVLMWSSVVYFPVLIPHLKLVLPCLSYSYNSYTTNPFFSDLTCWRGVYGGYFVLSLVVVTGMCTLVYFTTMCFYNYAMPSGRQVREYSLNNKYTSVAEAGMLLVKTVLIVLSIAGHQSSWRIALGAIALIGGVFTTYQLLWYMPYWHDTAMLMHVFQALILGWTGLVSLFMVAFDDAEGTGMLYFIVLPVLAVAAQMLSQWRIKAVGDLNERELTHPAMIMVKIRYLARVYFKWLAQFGDVYIEASEAHDTMLGDCMTLVGTVMELGIERFPDSADVHLFAAQYYMFIANNRVLAFRSLNHATQAPHQQLEHRFRCQAMRSMLHVAMHADQSVEVRHYTEFRARRFVADKAISDAMRALVIFWTEVMQTRPDIEKLATTGERARNYLNTAIAHFERLLEINPQSIPVLRLYGVLCLEILGDVGRAQQLFQQADSLANMKKKLMVDYNYGEFLRRIALKLDIFDEENGIISLSIDSGTMGMVESVNPAFLRMLGYNAQSDIVGKNIDVILPEPIRTYHNRYMEDYLVTRQSNVVNHTRMVMAVHASHGHLIPFAMYVRWSDEALGKMIAVLQPISNSYETCLIVDPKSMAITTATANFATVFGYSRRDILACRIKLFDVLPALKDDEMANNVSEEVYSQLASLRGHNTFGQHVLTLQRFHLHCYLTHIKVYEDSFYFLRCQVSQIQSSDDNDYVSEVESDLDEIEVVDVATFNAMAGRSPSSRARPSMFQRPLHGNTRGNPSRPLSPSAATATPTVTAPKPAPSSMAVTSPFSAYPPMHLSLAVAESSEGTNSATALNLGPNDSDRDSEASLSPDASQYTPVAAPPRFALAARSLPVHARHPMSLTLDVGQAATVPMHPKSSTPNNEMLYGSGTANGVSLSHDDGAVGVGVSATPGSVVSVPVVLPYGNPTAGQRAQSPFYHQADAMGDTPVFTPYAVMSPAPASLALDYVRGDALLRPQALMEHATEPIVSAAEDGALSSISEALHSKDASFVTAAADSGSEDVAGAGSDSVLPVSHSFAGVAPVRSQTIALGEDFQAHNLQLKTSGALSPMPEHLSSPTAGDVFPAVSPTADAHGSVIVPPSHKSDMSDLMRRRRNHAQKRLKKAIENDNARTVRRLSLFNSYALCIIGVTLALILTDFFLSAEDLKHVDMLVDNIYYAALRQTQATLLGCNFFLYYLFYRNPQATNLTRVFYRPLAHPDDKPSTIIRVAGTRIRSLVSSFSANSRVVDDMVTDSAARVSLRRANTQQFMWRTAHTPEKYGLTRMSMNNLVFYVSALADWSIFEGKMDPSDDYGEFFVVSNTASRAIPNVFDRDTNYTMEEALDRIQFAFTITVVMFAVTLFAAIFIASVLLMPMLIQVERSKARVLDVFLSVPQSVRKALRQKAVRVYRLVEKVEDADKSMRVSERDDDDEDEGDQTDGAMSVGASEATSLTHATSIAGGEDAYAALFKRYNNLRVLNEGMSSGDDANEDEKQFAHRNRSGRVGTVIQSARHTGADDDAATDCDGQVAMKSKKKGAKGPRDDMSMLSGLSGDTLTDADAHAVAEARAASRYNVWTGGAVRVAGFRFAVFVCILCAYFIVLLVTSAQYEATMHNSVHRVVEGSNRNPRIVLALFYTLNHLFYNKDELQATSPLDPRIHTPRSFSEEGMDSINGAADAFFNVVFGDGKNIIGRSPVALQNEVTFGNLCEIEETLLYYYPDGKNVPHLLSECEEADNMILTQGLYAVFQYIQDQYHFLLQPKYNKAFSYLITNDPQPYPEEEFLRLKKAFDVIYMLFNDFTYHHMLYSGLIYRSSALADTAHFNLQRYIFLGVCLALVVLSFFFLIRPTSIILARSSNQANAMMLLLPAQILRHVPAAQQYVQENISGE